MAATLATPQLEQTNYQRVSCDIGMVHVGFGAFHRAHQAVYVDEYMEKSGDLRWGIAAINLRASETTDFKAAQQGANGYLLKTTTPASECAYRLVRPHIRFADWSQDKSAAESLLALQSVHAVSLTVTESGYYLDNHNDLNVNDPVIASEIAGANEQSVYAFLAKGLAIRASETGNPLTILCCDNIRANGHMLEKNLITYLNLTGRDQLAEWVKNNVTFPCSMVDRITPRATPELFSQIDHNFPGQSLSPIHAEAFIQWVIEDKFAGPMPDLSAVGVQIVDDVDPFEEAKIRILNGGHIGNGYLGALAGHKTFDQTMQDPLLRAHFDGYEQNEVLPGLNIALPFEKQTYLAEIAARFCNVAIADQLERICMDGFSKMPIYIRPTLQSCLEQGIDPVYGFDCVASWYVYARRFANGQMPIHYHEPYWNDLKPLLAEGSEEDFARLKILWSDLPDLYPQFVSGITSAIQKLENQWPV